MFLRNKLLISINFLIITILLLSGCESANAPSDSGSLLVKVTDAPFPIDIVASAIVTIDSIEIRQKGGTEDKPFIVIINNPMDFDLVELRNGITSSLPEIDIPVGSYDLVRLYVASAHIVLKDGLGEFDLKIPSGDQTGIKIFLNPEIQIQGELTAELLLDFDLSKSFVLQGSINSINGFSFKPVVRAVNNSLAGSIYGTVTDVNGPLVGVLITVILGEESATAITDENGSYEILGIKEGFYSVSAVFNGYIDGQASDVEVNANNISKHDFILTTN